MPGQKHFANKQVQPFGTFLDYKMSKLNYQEYEFWVSGFSDRNWQRDISKLSADQGFHSVGMYFKLLFLTYHQKDRFHQACITVQKVCSTSALVTVENVKRLEFLSIFVESLETFPPFIGEDKSNQFLLLFSILVSDRLHRGKVGLYERGRY